VCGISFNPFWKFLRLRNLAWDFLGANCWSRDFFGVLIFAPIRSSLSLETQSTPLGEWHEWRRHVSPIWSQSMPRIRNLLTFLVKAKDLQLLKVLYQCEIGSEGYNDTEKVEKSTWENRMKSSIILLLKNVWLFISYVRLTACVSILLDTGDYAKFFAEDSGVKGLTYLSALHYTFCYKWGILEGETKMEGCHFWWDAHSCGWDAHSCKPKL